MAGPIINSVPPASLTLQSGETQRIVIDAFDPDAASGDATVTVTDSQGNETPVLVAISIEDPITYAVADTDMLGLTITAVPGRPNEFDITAPA